MKYTIDKDNTRYEVDLSQPPIGEGGTGRVYVGTMISPTGEHREVAVKFLYEDLPATMVERARREASIRIKNDNLIEMIDFITTEDPQTDGTSVTRIHVISELLNGVMLRDLLNGEVTDKNGQTVEYAAEMYRLYQKEPKRFALEICRRILSALLALHDYGYIHRDIDPSNIMLTHDGKIKLIDLGIAHPIGHGDSSTTSVGTFVGKALYAAPELVLGDIEHQDSTTDIYAVGILLFQLITGHLPFTGPLAEVMKKQQKDPLPLKTVKHVGIRTIIDRATKKDQSERYGSASEFRIALDKIDFEKDCPEIDKNFKKWHEVLESYFYYIIAGVAILGLTLGILFSL